MNTTQNTHNIDETIKMLEKFGFKFFGYNENQMPLVLAQNGQVVEMSVAYNFLQTQLKTAQTASESSSIESPLTSVPLIENNIPLIDTNVEKHENTVDKPIENITIPMNSKISAPKISIPIKSPSPYSDGQSKFDDINLDLTDPNNILKLQIFIKSNAKKNNDDPLKWLSFMFQKTLDEIREEENN